MINVRIGRSDDVIKVSRLWLQMINELAPSYNPSVLWWRSHAIDFMKSDKYKMYVAEIGGKIVGFIDYFLFPEPATSNIHCVGQHFFVLLEHRKKGIAEKLWKKAVSSAKIDGATVFELFCFEKELEFWKRHKFSLKRCLVRR